MTYQRMMSFAQVKEFVFNGDVDSFIAWMKQDADAWNDVSTWSSNFDEYSSVEEAIADDEFFDDWSHEADWMTGYYIDDDGKVTTGTR